MATHSRVLAWRIPGMAELGGPVGSHRVGHDWSDLASCLTFCHPMDYSPPGSSVHGILPARILEWVAMPPSRGSSQEGDRTCVSRLAGAFLTTEPPGKAPHALWEPKGRANMVPWEETWNEGNSEEAEKKTQNGGQESIHYCQPFYLSQVLLDETSRVHLRRNLKHCPFLLSKNYLGNVRNSKLRISTHKANRHIKKMLNISNDQRKAKPNYNELPPHTSQNGHQ